jgi:PIN domain nuclease of toxin-antitoxin system
MTLLLDTHAFLWSLIVDPRLSKTARDEIERTSNDVLVSAASFWEISIKYGQGKMPLPDVPDRYLPAQRIIAGFDLLSIEEPEACLVHGLPPHHRDPFDRLLVAQANCYGLVIVTNDPLIQRYSVRTLW